MTESDIDILEGYFKKYPDVPKETILKQHMLSLGHWFSDAALDACEGALVKSYRLFSYDLVPMSYFKRNDIGACRNILSCSTARTACARWRFRLHCRRIRPISSTSSTAAWLLRLMAKSLRKCACQKHRITTSRACRTARHIMRSSLSLHSSRSFAIVSIGAPRKNANSATSTRTRAR